MVGEKIWFKSNRWNYKEQMFCGQVKSNGGGVQKDELTAVSPQRSLSSLRKNSKVSVGPVAKHTKLDTPQMVQSESGWTIL